MNRTSFLPAAVVLALGSCATAPDASTVPEDGMQANHLAPATDQVTTAVSGGSLVNPPASFNQMVRSSALVVIGTVRDTRAVAADEHNVSGLQVPRVTLDVSHTLRGQAPTGPLVVRLANAMGDQASTLRVGHTYVLFLDQFEWTRGMPTGEWVVPGGNVTFAADTARPRQLGRQHVPAATFASIDQLAKAVAAA